MVLPVYVKDVDSKANGRKDGLGKGCGGAAFVEKLRMGVEKRVFP
jgi:hypothetical protein